MRKRRSFGPRCLEQPFRDVEDEGIGAIANRVHLELESGGIGVEHQLLELLRRMHEQSARRRVVGVGLEERRRARAHRAIGEDT